MSLEHFLYSLFWRKLPFKYSVFQGSNWDIKSPSQLVNGTIPFSIHNQRTIVSSVICLFFPGCPATVIWLIVAVCILSIQGMFLRWSRTNIAIKCFERFVPFIANFDTSTSVVLINFTVRISTASPHVDPNLILGRVSHAVFQIALVFTSKFFSQASAAPNGTRSKISTIDYCYLTAVAFAFIKSGSIRQACSFIKNSESIKLLPLHFDYFWHDLSQRSY